MGKLLAGLFRIAFVLVVATVAGAPSVSGRQLPLETLKLPPGFTIELFADRVPGARSMALGPEGTLFVGNLAGDTVYAVRDEDGDNRAETVIPLLQGLNMASGVAVHGGALFVAELDRVLRFDGIEGRLDAPPEPVVVDDSFPDRRHHGGKFIRFGPDGLLYVPVGAPCNVCDPAPPFASILRMRPDGPGSEVFVRGVRNTVGFDWHPETGELWFTDNGRDWLGDDLPPDELNRASGPGLHFGYPFCHAGYLLDPDYGGGHDCAEYTPPAQRLGPHVAALGMRFYTGSMFPPEYRNQIFIAEHGSWNRSRKIGYRVSLVRLDGNRPVSYEAFAEGWLKGERSWGRPVDVEVMPDGALLVSDDQAGAIYRISYSDADG